MTSVAFRFVISADAVVNPVDKLSVALVMFVDTAFVFNSVAIVDVVTFWLVIRALAAVIPVVKTRLPDETKSDPVVIADIFMLDTVALNISPFTTYAPVALICPAVMLVILAFPILDVVILAIEECNVPELTLVDTIADPITCKVADGLVVPMPTLPDVVNKLPIVFEL